MIVQILAAVALVLAGIWLADATLWTVNLSPPAPPHYYNNVTGAHCDSFETAKWRCW